MPRTSLTRSSSLESPKKLRFATDAQLENYRYHRFVFNRRYSKKYLKNRIYPLQNRYFIPIIFETICRYSDDALMEVISDCSLRKSRSSSVVCDELTSSCPCIDHVDKTSAVAAEMHPLNSCLNANTPLLLNHVST